MNSKTLLGDIDRCTNSHIWRRGGGGDWEVGAIISKMEVVFTLTALMLAFLVSDSAVCR